MGRDRKEVDITALIDAAGAGLTAPEMAKTFDVSLPTMRRIVSDVQKEQGLILQYRALQSLQLTALQAKVLDAITPDKIDQADLKDLVIAYKVLKDKEHTIDGKPSDIKGFVGYLVEAERVNMAKEDTVEVEEADYKEVDPEALPELQEIENGKV